MDTFVVREPEKKDPHLAVHKSAKDQAMQYPGVFHADNGPLFCPLCNIVLDHMRKSVLNKHLDSSHKKKANQADASSGQEKLHLSVKQGHKMESKGL